MSEKPWGYQKPTQRPEPDWELDPQTQSVRAGLARSGFGETSEALYLNSGFTYESAEQATSSFAEETDHFLYSRFHNPTVAMFENRLAAIEGAEFCVATGSGMSAMFASLACIVEQGDHIARLQAQHLHMARGAGRQVQNVARDQFSGAEETWHANWGSEKGEICYKKSSCPRTV